MMIVMTWAGSNGALEESTVMKTSFTMRKCPDDGDHVRGFQWCS